MANISSSNSQRANVPKLRFPGFEGEWKETLLSEFSQFLPGLTYKPEDVKTDGKLVLRSSNIQNAQLDFNDNVYVDNSIVPDRIRTRSNDVLMCVRNGSKSLVGKTALISNEHSDLAWGAFMTVLRPNTNNTLLYHYLNSSSFRKQVFPDLETATVKQITMSTLNRITLFVPNTDEQNKISDFLSALDKRIEKQRQLIEALKSYKRGALSKLFPQNGETKPEYRFAGFTGPWEQRKLGDLIDVCSGRDYKHLSAGDVPVYGTGGYMLSVSEALSYDKDAIGIGRKGTIDKPYILTAPFWTVDTLFYAIPRKNIDLNFAFDIFQNIDWKKKDESTGVPSLSKTVINEIDVLVPKYDEQQALGQFFYGLDNLITLNQHKHDTLLSLKKVLLQQLFI